MPKSRRATPGKQRNHKKKVTHPGLRAELAKEARKDFVKAEKFMSALPQSRFKSGRVASHHREAWKHSAVSGRTNLGGVDRVTKSTTVIKCKKNANSSQGWAYNKWGCSRGTAEFMVCNNAATPLYASVATRAWYCDITPTSKTYMDKLRATFTQGVVDRTVIPTASIPGSTVNDYYPKLRAILVEKVVEEFKLVNFNTHVVHLEIYDYQYRMDGGTPTSPKTIISTFDSTEGAAPFLLSASGPAPFTSVPRLQYTDPDFKLNQCHQVKEEFVLKKKKFLVLQPGEEHHHTVIRRAGFVFDPSENYVDTGVNYWKGFSGCTLIGAKGGLVETNTAGAPTGTLTIDGTRVDIMHTAKFWYRQLDPLADKFVLEVIPAYPNKGSGRNTVGVIQQTETSGAPITAGTDAAGI